MWENEIFIQIPLSVVCSGYLVLDFVRVLRPFSSRLMAPMMLGHTCKEIKTCFFELETWRKKDEKEGRAEEKRNIVKGQLAPP